MLLRVATGVTGAAVVVGAIWLGAPWLTLLALVGGGLAIREFYLLAPPGVAPMPVALGVVAVFALLLAAQAASGRDFHLASGLVLAAWAFAAILWFIACYRGKPAEQSHRSEPEPPCHSKPEPSCHSEPGLSRRSEPGLSCHSERSEESGGGDGDALRSAQGDSREDAWGGSKEDGQRDRGEDAWGDSREDGQGDSSSKVQNEDPEEFEPDHEADEDAGWGERPWLGFLFLLLGPVYIGFLLGHGLAIRDLSGGDGDLGRSWLLFTLLVVFACDTGAFAAGRLVGRHRMAPRISPNKTWEGAAGGLIASVGAALLVGLVFDLALPVWHQALIGAAASLAAQLGDLVESALKRAAHVKDSGSIMPGHGGILDRMDSILFALPAVYYMLMAAGFPL